MISTGINISIFLICVGFVFKKSNIIFFLQIFWVFILCAFSNGGIDYYGNEAIYRESGKSFLTIGTGWLSNIFAYIGHKMEWDYMTYNAVLVFFALSILVFVIKKVCKYPCIVMSLFIIYPLVDSIYQKRFFIAMCFCVLAFYFYMKDRMLQFMLCIFLAVGFHFSPVVYFFFPLVKILLNYKRRWIFMIIIVLETLIFQYLPVILEWLNLNTLKLKFLTYSQEQVYSSFLVAALYFFLQLAFTIMAVIIANKYQMLEDNRNEKIVELNINSLILLPLLILGATYSRYFRIFMIFNYALVADRIGMKGKRNTYSYLFSIGFVILLATSSYIILSNGAYTFTDKMESVFENNYLFESWTEMLET